MNKRGFTLVELLVVITILSILVSLLVPNLNRMFYKAQVISCLSNVKQITNGLLIYTNDAADFYPSAGRPRVKAWTNLDRKTNQGPGDNGPINGISYEAGDLKPILKPYFGDTLNGAFMCPLVTKSTFQNGNLDETIAMHYNLYFNCSLGSDINGFKRVLDDKWMRKLGDRFYTKIDPADDFSGSKYWSSGVLVADYTSVGTFNHVPAHGYKTQSIDGGEWYPTTNSVDSKLGLGGLNYSYDDGSAKSLNDIVCLYYNNPAWNPLYNARGILERIGNMNDIILPYESLVEE